MFNQQVRRVMENEKFIQVGPEMTVAQAAQRMAERATGAVVVVDDQRSVIGIFTERDAVSRVIARNVDPQTTRLADVMTATPITVAPDRSFGHALQLMHQHGIRHLPVVENGQAIGIVTGRDAMDPEMEEFVVEALRRESSTR
jgi:signal-transduction protein with cAMP-binding, CBS, and nucleotidyltransferase domain